MTAREFLTDPELVTSRTSQSAQVPVFLTWNHMNMRLPLVGGGAILVPTYTPKDTRISGAVRDSQRKQDSLDNCARARVKSRGILKSGPNVTVLADGQRHTLR